MEPGLRDLLRAVAVDSVNYSHTHVTLYGTHARWTIQPHRLTDFWNGYCDLVDRKTNGRDGIPEEPFSNICLAERPQDVMPQIAKLTFRFHADNNDNDNENWEPYDDEFLQWLCHTYQTVLSEYFCIVNENKMELLVVVLESTTHWYEEDTENGQRFMVMEVRIQFPYARIDAGMQNRVVRPRVIQLLRNNNVLAKMQRHPVGDWEQIISANTVNDPVALYGSNEVQGRPKLSITHIWQHINRDILESGILPMEVSLVDAFVTDNHTHVQQQAVNREIFDNKDLTYWTPMFLSLGYWPALLMPKPELNDGNRFTTQLRIMNNNAEHQHVFGVGNRRHEEIDLSDIELCERMLQMINPQRFFKELFWLDIGKALYISDQGGDNGLLSWIHHTERSLNGISNVPEYMMTADSVSETCRNLYYTFANSSITVKTLAWYAREDSPERYANWHRDWCLSSMEQALSCYHTDVAISLHRVYWLDFIYCPLGKGKWFQFKNHRWFEVNQGIELRKAISKDFMKRFEAARMVLSRQIHDSNDEGFKSNAEITMKKITSLIGKLKSVPFKSSIMTEACEHFNNDKFITLLDNNPELTGVTNGVLEIINNVIIFRHAKPEDYLSMCTNIPYHANYSWNHPLVLECMKWFGQCFTDRTLLHHFLKFASSCMKGRNSDKIFPIWTGEGDNSKSMLVKLFEATFNSYCIKFPVSLLSEKGTNPSGPTPQLARAKATRVAFLDEPEDDVPMHKGTIKRYTGGDSFFARLLQDNGGDVQATFKMILMCNKVPIIPNADKAIKNRTRLFPFMSTWVDNPPEDEKEQYRLRKFKKNPIFERRIPILAPAFLWIMTQYYPYYAEEGLADPPIITETTEAYWTDNDVYAQFAADTIQEVYSEDGTRDSTARITLSEIYSEFKSWFRDAFPGTKVPERSIVRGELSSRWGRMHGNAWHGIRIIASDGPTDMTAALIGGRKKELSTRVAPTIATLGADKSKLLVKEDPKNIIDKSIQSLVLNKPQSPNKNNLIAIKKSNEDISIAKKSLETNPINSEIFEANMKLLNSISTPIQNILQNQGTTVAI